MRLARAAFEARYAVGNRMKVLLVDGENGCLGFENAGVIQSPNFHNHSARAGWRAGPDCSAAGLAKVSRHWVLEVAARKFARRPFGKTKCLVGVHHDEVGVSTGNVLALSAVALERILGFTRQLIPDFAAVAASARHDLFLVMR